MPPYVPRKRLLSASPPATSPPPNKKRALKTTKARPNVFETLDAEPSPAPRPSAAEAFLQSLESADSSLSDADSDDFEDVLPASHIKRRNVDNGEGDTDEEMEWEDALPAPVDGPPSSSAHKRSGILELVLSRPHDAVFSRMGAGGKKGPTKIERMIRVQTHCMHVQFLLWHNSIRNSWINDQEVQASLRNGLSESIKAEVSKWRTAMGYIDDHKKERTQFSSSKSGKGQAKGKGKAKEKSTTQSRHRTRDWGAEASKLEPGTPNLSRGDPLIRLLKYLAAYWKKRFRITTPGLRKIGHRSAAELSEEVKSFHNDPHDTTRHGERITSLEEFRNMAKNGEGSRDTSAQLFTALLRALGIEARLVASLQPTGFGWTKAEEAKPRKSARNGMKSAKREVFGSGQMSSDDSDASNIESSRPVEKASSLRMPTKTTAERTHSCTTSTPIDIEDNSSSELSSAPNSDDDETPVVDLSLVKPSSSSKSIDRDLRYPIYWTEALSPISNAYYPISSSVNPNLATAPEHYAGFEPRGAAADKAKQVFCYVVAYSSDGTAKDVTVRYLKRHQLPGKTKGVRLPVEKIPIYNKRGKVLKYEDYDWFKRVMSCYARSSIRRTVADDIEEQGDLVPFKPAPTVKDGSGAKGVETLQGYKNSAEFILERHLRREEAILPNAKPVKHFTVGKGEKATEEPVYRREDVVSCKTVESWHKEGRQLRTGEQPLKFVPFRAVTLIRIRELEDTHRETGEKPTQGLYSKEQTEWIIPDPVQDGRIPKNGFGNIDVYVPSMVPAGAIHLRLKGTAKICRKLGIDYAEACTGFEFGNRRAVPILTGVVVAEGNKQMLIDAWTEEERIKKEKEEGKREQRALAMWKKFLHGLRVIKRISAEYGIGNDVPDEANPFVRKQSQFTNKQEMQPSDENGDNAGGGFLVDEDDAALETQGGGFLLYGEDDESAAEGGKGFIADDDKEKMDVSEDMIFELNHGDEGLHTSTMVTKAQSTKRRGKYADTPISLQSAHRETTPIEEHVVETVEDEAEEISPSSSEEKEEEEDDDAENDSDNYAPAKSKQAPRGHGGRSQRVRGAVKARPARNKATSSPYFKNGKK